MKKIALEARRNQVMEQMEEGSVAVIYSGIDIHVSLDEYFPFEVNKSFFYRSPYPIYIVSDDAQIHISLFIVMKYEVL